MIKALIAVAACIVSFGIGLLGVYQVAPLLFPELEAAALPEAHAAESAEAHGADPHGAPADSAAAHAPAVALVQADAHGAPAAHGAAAAAHGAPAAAHGKTPASGGRATPGEKAVLLDSLSLLRAELAVYKARAAAQQQRRAPTAAQAPAPTATQKEQQQARAQAAAQAAERTTELGAALSKVGDRELKGILSSLDMDAFERLYEKSSGKNRARLLQSLPPERAAAFVSRMATTAPAAPAPADKTPVRLSSAENAH